MAKSILHVGIFLVVLCGGRRVLIPGVTLSVRWQHMYVPLPGHWVLVT